MGSSCHRGEVESSALASAPFGPRLPRGGNSLEGRSVRPLLRLSAVFIAVVALAPPAVADPLDPIPGNGVFVVGPDIAPGLYHTGGSGGAFGGGVKQKRPPG